MLKFSKFDENFTIQNLRLLLWIQFQEGSMKQLQKFTRQAWESEYFEKRKPSKNPWNHSDSRRSHGYDLHKWANVESSMDKHQPAPLFFFSCFSKSPKSTHRLPHDHNWLHLLVSFHHSSGKKKNWFSFALLWTLEL